MNLIEKALPFYQSEAREAGQDEKTLGYYREAVNEVESWLKSVLRRDILENGYSSVKAVIHLPSGDLVVETSAADACGEAPLYFAHSRGGTPEVFHTPIGDFDAYTYNALIWEQGNPVRQLFKYFDGIITSMRCSLSHALEEQNQRLITDGMLREYRWYDVLGLHRMVYGSLDEVLPAQE